MICEAWSAHGKHTLYSVPSVTQTSKCPPEDMVTETIGKPRPNCAEDNSRIFVGSLISRWTTVSVLTTYPI